MKLLRITMKQCDTVKGIGAEEYLGTRLGSCPLRIEHIVVAGKKIERVKKSCDHCILAKLYHSTYVVGNPTLTQGGGIVFLAIDTREVRRMLNRHRDELINVEEVDPRSIYLTPRQKEALRLLATGEATNISRLARRLGITKPAALKLFRKSLQKLAKRHAG